MKNFFFFGLLVFTLCAQSTALAHEADPTVDPIMEQRFIQVEAKNKEARSSIADTGMSIEFLRTDSVWGFADAKSIQELTQKGFKILGNFDRDVARGGHQGIVSFPGGDDAFHDYSEMTKALRDLEKANPELAKVHVIGKSLEGRDLLAIQINSEPASLAKGQSNKPGVIYMGNHHAREHLSIEVPLMFAQHLLTNKNNAQIRTLLESRDIWIVPMVNPDGAEYDVSSSRYKMWRKNRRDNGDGTFGVDLNRNYSYRWGTGGSSKNTNSETYMGPKPFSEPETQTMKAFVESHLNAKVLLTFHTFSELILYPWGSSLDPIVNTKDLGVFTQMAKTMSTWNGYTPEQSSDLYTVSGDTTDWAYGEHGIFAFTFELSPKSSWGGGFYPGAKAIQPTFQANLKPCLYLLEVAEDPYQVLNPITARRIKNKFEMNPLDF
jgi:carboxypeptidase T